LASIERLFVIGFLLLVVVSANTDEINRFLIVDPSRFCYSVGIDFVCGNRHHNQQLTAIN